MVGKFLLQRRGVYLVVAVMLVIVYSVGAWAIWGARTWSTDGPLSFNAPSVTRPLSGSPPLDSVAKACAAQSTVGAPGSTYRTLKIVGGSVDGADYYGCYAVKSDGTVFGAAVLTADSLSGVTSASVLKAGGAWRWIALVKTPLDIALGGVAVALLGWLYYLYYRKPRPAPPPGPWYASRMADIGFGIVAFPGIVFVWALRGRTRARKMRVTLQMMIGWSAFAVALLCVEAISEPDALSLFVVGLMIVAALWGWGGGVRLVRPESGWAYRGDLVSTAGPSTGPALPAPSPAAPDPIIQQVAAPGVPSGPSGPAAETAATDSSPRLTVLSGAALPTFARVGGMDALKEELRATIGDALAFGAEAKMYGIEFNGVLLHGPAGTGKTYIAKATAGEFGMSLIHLTTADVVSKYVGDSARNIEHAFATALANLPCLLFFDEFDSIAGRREDEPNSENRRIVDQLLTSLEKYRSYRDLVIVAATNHLDQLDPAVVRPGRFDRHIRIDLPDLPARAGIIRSALSGRPAAADIDIEQVAERTEGLTPAAITAIIDTAARSAFHEYTTNGVQTPITTAHLLDAITAHGGQDRPALGKHSWTDLVLDEATLHELQDLQRLVEDPDRARAYGIEPPSGLLLAGPPGTGKTSIARTLAAQSKCSFYPLSTADITSKWVGEAEQNIKRIFERARENAPSIVFIDEIDAIAAERGSSAGALGTERPLTQLLAEIDGVGTGPRRVFVVAATNRPDILDPALTRGGRLSRTINVPLPDIDGRQRLLAVHAHGVPLAADVDLAGVAGATAGFSGGDIRALVQQAGLHAYGRSSGSAAPQVEAADFASAIAALSVGRAAAAGAAQPSFRDLLPPPRTGNGLAQSWPPPSFEGSGDS